MKIRRILLSILTVGVVMLTAHSCNKNPQEEQKKKDDLKLAEYVAEHAPTAALHSSGFYYLSIDPLTDTEIEGSGRELKKNDVVSFNYKISLLDGTLIESNIIEGVAQEPAIMKLQSFSVIPEALDNAISLMKLGESYRFIVPSYISYGSYSTKEFGPYSSFVIDIETIKVSKESDIYDYQLDSLSKYVDLHYGEFEVKEYASGLFFVDSIPGTGERPYDRTSVIIDFSRKYLDNSVVHSLDGVVLELDRGQAVEGLEDGIKLTREGGTSILLMPSAIAFQQSACVIPEKAREPLFKSQILTNNVKPYSLLKYEVHLKVVNL